MSVVTNTSEKSPSQQSSWGKTFLREILKKPSYTPPTLRKQSFLDKYAYLLYVLMAFLIPFLLMFFAFKIMGVAPYGDKQILVTDLWHQYYPFLVDYQSKLKAGESLLWSWTSGGGTNYIALIAYYLASPLNFFSVLVPADQLREFLFVITCVKIGLAGMFYSLFIRITFGRKDISITAFGIMYSLCAFIMGYYWNIIWLDSVALLPLVAAGTFALLRHGKFKLYIISLALSILANYYIGLFICIAVVLVSVGYTIVEFRGLKQLIKDFFKMLGCSIVAIMMTALLTLPAYFSLGHAYSSSKSFPEKFAVNMGSTADFAGVLEGICKTISNSVAFVQPTSKEGLPNVYTGIITIFLAILFLFCAKIKLRERLVCGFLLLFFLTSFVIRQLDYIWHGFHFPNMLPYRFSFLWSFLLIYMAFRVFMYIDHVKLASVLAAIAGFFVYLYLAGIYFKDENIHLSSLFKVTEEGAEEVDPILLSGWIGTILAAWVLLYVLRERLPRLFIALGALGISIASLYFFLEVYKKIDPSLLKAKTTAGGADANLPTSPAIPDSFPTIFTVVFILVMLVVVGLLLSRLNANHVILKSVISVVLVLFALFEGLFSATTGVRTVSVTDATSYPLGTTSTAECVDYVDQLEGDNTDLARTEFTRYHTLNDDALNGVNGISMFNSMVNMPITNYMERFGICGWIASNRYSYMQSSPFTDMMLNIKYLIDPYYGKYVDTEHYDKIYVADSSGSGVPAIVMQNRYYIPMGFMVNEDLLKYDTSNTVGFMNKIAKTDFVSDTVPVTDNPIENQNNFFRLSTGIDQDLYIPLEVFPEASVDKELTKTQNNHFSYSSQNNSDSYTMTATATGNGTALTYVSGYGVEDTTLYVDEQNVGHYGTKRPLIMMIGDVKAGQKIKVEAKVNNNTSGSITCNIVMLDEAMFQKAHELFSRSVMTSDKVTGDEISGTIDVAEDGLFYTSIPYVTGWHAIVDGQEVEITPVGDAMLSFKLTKGTHTIRLTYSPEGFKAGVVVSILGLVIFILMILAVWQKKRLLPICQKAASGVIAKLPFRKSAPAANDAEAANAPPEAADESVEEADVSAKEDDEPADETDETVEETDAADEDPVTE